MKRVLFAAVAALALTGCAGFQGNINTVGEKVCDNYAVVKAGLELALVNAYTISHAGKREAAIAAVQFSLSALERCPKPS